MRSVALVVTFFLLFSVGIGLVEAGGPPSGSKGIPPDPPHPLAPSEPLSLMATPGVFQVGLAWLPPSFIDPGYPITNYKVYRGTAPGTAMFLVDAGNVLTHTDTGLMSGVTYYYQVSAFGLGEGPQSNEASATPTGTTTAPTAPRNLQATAGVVQVDLMWQAPLSDGGSPITNYKVYRGTAPGTAIFLANAGASLSYTDMAVMAAQTYYYQASAESTIGEGPRSNEAFAMPTATATAPSAPQNLVATVGVVQVDLMWQAPLSDGGSPITNYKVYRGTAPGTAIFLVDAGNVLTHTDTAVMAGQTYYYQVSAENSIGEGSQSNEASATPTTADPSISIVEPTAGATVGTVMFLQVQITAFIIDAENVGQATVPGRGHYHVTVDGTTIDFTVTGLIYAVKDLTEGQHTVKVSLHNNDHSALTPEVDDEVTVTVAAPTSPPAGIDSALFAGTTIGLIALLIVVAVALILWGRRGRQAP